MPSLEELQGKIGNAGDLLSIVRIMKTLASANVRQFQDAVDALEEYTLTIELGIQAVLQEGHTTRFFHPEEGLVNLGIVVFGSDHGLVGRFNDEVVNYALREAENYEPDPGKRFYLVLGERAYNLFEIENIPVDSYYSAPASLSAVTPAVQNLLEVLDAWQVRRDLGSIVLYYNAQQGVASFSPESISLLPLDKKAFGDLAQGDWPSRTLPGYTMQRRELFLSLVREYFFMMLYRVFVLSLAGENASRLKSMQAAEQNIEDRLAELTTRYHQARQEAVTEEMLETVAGFEALVGDKWL